jgi:hypothetical protein
MTTEMLVVGGLAVCAFIGLGVLIVYGLGSLIDS